MRRSVEFALEPKQQKGVRFQSALAGLSGRLIGLARESAFDPAHVQTAARLRHAFQNPVPRPAGDPDLVRNLVDYDAAFGVDLDGQVA